jgi:hypothetical protein
MKPFRIETSDVPFPGAWELIGLLSVATCHDPALDTELLGLKNHRRCTRSILPILGHRRILCFILIAACAAVGSCLVRPAVKERAQLWNSESTRGHNRISGCRGCSTGYSDWLMSAAQCWLYLGRIAQFRIPFAVTLPLWSNLAAGTRHDQMRAVLCE